jgi:hypothetical protein
MKHWIWILVLSFVASLCIFPIQSEDLFMYLALGRRYFETGSFPAQDPFLFPATHSWTILHQWLSYLVFYGLYWLGGFSAILFAKTLAIVGILAFPLIWARKDKNAIFFWAASVLIGSLAMSFRWNERSSMFSDIFVTLVLGVLLAEVRGPSRWKYGLPGIFLVWVNLHPGFPTGWALCGLFLAVRIKQWKTLEYRKFVAVVAASVLVALLNPRGLEGLLYPFVFSQNEGQVFRKLYFEWYPTMDPLFFWNPQTLFIFALIALNLFLLYLARHRRPVFELLASAFLILYGLYAVRFVPTMGYGLILLNTVLALKSPWPSWVAQGRKVAAALALVLAVKNVGWGYEMISGHRDFGLGLDPAVVPVKAAELVMRNYFIGNVFNSHMFGSYLAWAWDGRRKIFYHGFVTDTDFYLRDYIGFYRGRESFDALVTKYDIKVFLLDRFAGNAPLLKTLSEHPGWQLTYMDEGSLVFAPKDLPEGR